jgi:hypothetical protein
MDTCAGDVLLLADEIATGWVEGVLAFCVRGVEPKYFSDIPLKPTDSSIAAPPSIKQLIH